MDPLVEKYKLVLNQSSTRLPVVFSFVIRFAILLAGYQILSEEELAKAGINIDGHRSEQ
jgi:hypothetical protein